jgi:phosphoesterase RecJ-like protein
MRLDWASLLDLLKSRERFVLTSHVRPDCDALGSELGLAGILDALGKDVRIVNAQATPANLKWIDPDHRLESLAEKVTPADLADRDLLVVLDTSAFAQLGAMADVAKRMRDRVLVIDHHVSEDDLSDLWFKDTSAEATARIVYEIALRLRVPLTERIATPIYAGLSTDTGGFRFPSVSGESFRIAARLVDAGASPAAPCRSDAGRREDEPRWPGDLLERPAERHQGGRGGARRHGRPHQSHARGEGHRGGRDPDRAARRPDQGELPQPWAGGL